VCARSWEQPEEGAAESEEEFGEEQLDRGARRAPGASKRVLQKGGWTEDEDSRLFGCARGGAGPGRACGVNRLFRGSWSVASHDFLTPPRLATQPCGHARRAQVEQRGHAAGRAHRQAGAGRP